MTALMKVTVAAGVPVGGDGDASTIDALMADGGQATLGAKADGVWDGSSGTPSAVSLFKYIATKLEAIRVLSQKVSAALNGNTSVRIVSAASTNIATLKNAPGNLVNIDLFNNAAYDVFVKFYNKASNPVIGTDTPMWTVPIKAGQGYARSFVNGKSFAAGIAIVITKALIDSDTTVTAAGDVTGSIDLV